LKAAINGMVQLNRPLPEKMVAQLIQLLSTRRELFWPVQTLLRTQASVQTLADSLSHEGPPDKNVQQATARSWKQWYATAFSTPFPESAVFNKEKTDEEVHALIIANLRVAGDSANGRKIYERLQCNTCHGGGETPGQEGKLFGPDLTGVTQRLNAIELADAMVYPSKQVADRF
jgi:mono/diheme cytochrome c family protein